ncbi:MAG: acyl-CoA dehydrogenase family protein [Deltaproteobacteria bacterium]|nr:acyl-CoA dehydrogenase family protein [Deltaproteobacteria bacterium]
MHYELSDDMQMLRDTTRKFVQKELMPHTMRIEETRSIPPELIQRLRELGYFGIMVPEEFGGQNLGTLAYMLIQEQFAFAHNCFNLLISGSNGIGGMGVVYEGSDYLKKKYLPRLASGEVIAAFAITEPAAGSDAAAIETLAVKDGKHWVLNGRKHFITRADIAGFFTIIALTDRNKRAKGGITAFAIERDTPGMSITRHMASMGSDVVRQCEIVFENCRVPEENVIGQVGGGFRLGLRVLAAGRLSIAARSLGAMQRAQELTVAYAKQRIQFGEPIATKQAVQFMLADNEVDIATLREFLYATAWRKDQGQNVDTEASMCKLYGTEALWRVVDRCVQIHGGMGYMKECEIEHIFREARGLRIYEGTSEIQRHIIAKSLLKD